MNAINILLDKSKIASGASNDAGFARHIGVTRASVSNWRHGRNYPDAVQCARLAQLSGEPLARVLGIVGEERAISREEKQVWRALAQQIGVAAVVALCAVVTPAQSAPLTSSAISQRGMPIMLKKRRRWSTRNPFNERRAA